MPASRSALGPLGRHVADRGAALQVGLLGDQARPFEDLGEVAFGEPLALGDHAEAVRAGRFGGLRVLEDLLRLHHRVHRRVRLGVARLGAEAAVLGAAARLGVDQRAHVGRVAEVLLAHLPGALDQLADLLVVAQLAERQRFLEGDQGGHPAGLDLGCGSGWTHGERGEGGSRSRAACGLAGGRLRLRRGPRRRRLADARAPPRS